MWWVLVAACDSGPPPSPLRYPELTTRVMTHVDADHDGRVSAPEYEAVALPDQPMRTYDLDGDGSLSAVELERSWVDEDAARVARHRADELLFSVQGAGVPGQSPISNGGLPEGIGALVTPPSAPTVSPSPTPTRPR